MSLELPKIKIPKRKRILVIGSGNAVDIGKILFNEADAVIADESDYATKLKHVAFDQAFIISASGGKHAPLIAKKLRKKQISTTLLTNNPQAKASKYVKKTILFPSQKEPYTYNTSTYLSMILAKTKENPKKIYNQVKKVDSLLKKECTKYNAFYFILPKQFDYASDLFQTKFDELFGPKIRGDIHTIEQTKHAKTVVSSKTELFVSFGIKNQTFGYKQNRLFIPLPRNADYGALFCLGYYFIGKIQEKKRNYFKQSIHRYVKEASGLFKKNIKVIVDYGLELTPKTK